ncbi:SapC family protein [Desulfobotulus mexicanus]|uniref:SapC family protein n=1 Tax=Desulfobotulus mexicanus TaxID=2586642 RepID=A0A5S5MCM9_9BACT|nr:SapC family protein [Desulfobotulus mexicanus]TYT73487.1 SapC family protein [Desulfobotulus mexicanus]
MSKYQPVTKTDFVSLRWKRFDSYHFAGSDLVAPLVVQELPRAAMSLPIGFIRQNNQFITTALLGLQQGQNLCVSPEGHWIAPYIPAAYRSYPFALAEAENNQLVLCVDRESGLVAEYFDQAFFDGEGEPSQSVKDILDFLQQVRSNRELTLRMCAALDAEGLIQPWPVKVRGKHEEVQTLDGLFRIDEEKFTALSDEAICRVHQSGALAVVYCQLLSMQHIHALGKLAEKRIEWKPEEVDMESLFGDQGDILKFN